MPLYSASQLIDKTMLLNKACNIYRVIDVNNNGDNATPAFIANRGFTFVVDSFLGVTQGYTQNGVTYAARSIPYFTFFDQGGTYLCIAVIADGRFSLEALQSQGALSVAEQVAKDERDNAGPLANFLNDIGGGLKFLLLAAAVVMLFMAIKKTKKA